MANEYNSYLHKIRDMFNDDKFYNRCAEAIEDGQSSFKICQKYNKKVFDLEWLEVIEDCLPSLDHIVRNPRKFITIEEDIIDISLARSISVESVRHLAQHTNLIASFDEKNDTVTPSKILNTSKEESYEVYENRFIYTLLKKLYEFVNTRYDMIKKDVTKESNEIEIQVDTHYKYGLSNMQVRLDAIANMGFDEASRLDNNELTPIERVAKIHNIISGFLGSPFAKEMVGSAPVRPPITRTNVIKKEPNYKKALVLWQFIQSYSKVGFEVQVVNETREMNSSLSEQYKQLMFINNMIIQNLASAQNDVNDLSSMQDQAAANVENAQKSPKPSMINNTGDKDQGYTSEEFPEINLDLKETRKVYKKTNGDKLYNSIEYREITSAIDRVLMQSHINELHKKDEERIKLEKKQKEEEKRVRAKNLADKKREQARIKREEEMALKAAKRQAQLEERAKKQAILKRMKETREKERLLLEEQAREELERKIKDEYLLEMENKKKEIIAHIQSLEENKLNQSVEEIDALESKALKEFRESMMKIFEETIDRELVNVIDHLEDVKAESLNAPVTENEMVEQMKEISQENIAKVETSKEEISQEDSLNPINEELESITQENNVTETSSITEKIESLNNETSAEISDSSSIKLEDSLTKPTVEIKEDTSKDSSIETNQNEQMNKGDVTDVTK